MVVKFIHVLSLRGPMPTNVFSAVWYLFTRILLASYNDSRDLVIFRLHIFCYHCVVNKDYQSTPLSGLPKICHYVRRTNRCAKFGANSYFVLLHFAWVVDDAKCIVVTSVCVSVCVSVCPRPHTCTDPDVTCGSGRGCPLVVHYRADLQSVHELRCYGNITRTRNASECMFVLAVCLVRYLIVDHFSGPGRPLCPVPVCVCMSDPGRNFCTKWPMT